jgi:hypothetical protein
MITLEVSQDEDLRKYFDGREVTIGVNTYKYEAFYNRLEFKSDKETAVACPVCYNITFKIVYKDWDIVGICECGCELTVSE